MRVLAISPDFPPARGGIQTLAHRVMSQLPDADSRVITLATAGAAEFDSRQPIEIRRVGRSSSRKTAITQLNLAAVRAAIARHPDVIVSLHLVTAPAAQLLRSVLRIPYVQYVYAKEVEGRPGLARRALSGAARVIAIGDYSRSLCEAAGAPPERIRVVLPGVDLSEIPSRPPTRRPGSILTVARLADRYKGHDVMLRSMGLIRSRVPQAQWMVIGDGPLSDHLESLSRSLHVEDAVTFAGGMPDDARDRALWEAEVFALPSRVPPGGAGEGFGIVYLEAGGAQLPVVAGNEGGAVDAVLDGKTGLLVDPSDHIAVAGAVTRLLQDEELRGKLGAAGRAHAAAMTWQRAADAVRDVLAEVA